MGLVRLRGKAWYQAVTGEASPEVILERPSPRSPTSASPARWPPPSAPSVPTRSRCRSTCPTRTADLDLRRLVRRRVRPLHALRLRRRPSRLGRRHDAAKAEVTFGGPGVSLAQELWQDVDFPAHSGMIVNGWWRIVRVVLGLVALLLGITGLSTWLCTRGVQNRRRRRMAAEPADAGERPAPHGRRGLLRAGRAAGPAGRGRVVDPALRAGGVAQFLLVAQALLDGVTRSAATGPRTGPPTSRLPGRLGRPAAAAGRHPAPPPGRGAGPGRPPGGRRGRRGGLVVSVRLHTTWCA